MELSGRSIRIPQQGKVYEGLFPQFVHEKLAPSGGSGGSPGISAHSDRGIGSDSRRRAGNRALGAERNVIDQTHPPKIIRGTKCQEEGGALPRNRRRIT